MTSFIIKYRWWIIAIPVIAGIVFGALIPFAKTDPEIRNYVPGSLESRQKTDRIESEFGVQDMVLVIFRDSNLLSKQVLGEIKSFDRALSRLDGVKQKVSPFTMKSIRGDEGMMLVEPLIGTLPDNEKEANELRHKIKSCTMADGVVFSDDLAAAAITATLSNESSERETLGKIDSISIATVRTAEVEKGGLPYIRRYIMKDVRRDAIFIIPAALIIMLVILKLTLRKWQSLLMPFGVVVLSTTITMGLIPLLGWKISILTLLVPIIMVAVANNYGIYLAARQQEISREGNTDNKTLLERLTDSLNMPILFSGLTTIAGLLGLLAHSIIPARQVGLLTSAGVAIALLMSLLMIPALIYIHPPDIARDNKSKTGYGFFEKVLSHLSATIIKHPRKILTGAAVFTGIMATGIVLIKIETNQEKFFPADHPLRRTSQIINEKFGGSQTVSVMISGDIKDPAVLKSVDNLTGKLEGINGVGRVFSISVAIREMTKAVFQEDEDGYDKIPSTREGIAQLFELYNMSGDQGDFDQLMTQDNSKAHILVRLSDPSNEVIRNVRKAIETEAAAFPAKITTGGYAMIMADFAQSIIKGQVYSLLFAVITVFILLAIIFKSINGGITGSIPLFISIVILFGFMGFSGIALDAATALLSSLMIGVGVDFTIQYIWCFKNEWKKDHDYIGSTDRAIKNIGRSIMINGFSVMAGFSALVLSGFTSIRFFGYLVIISIGSCLVGAIVIIPALLIVFRPRFIEKEMSQKNNKSYEKDDSIIPVPSAAFTGSGTVA